jgi:hypothetical protein
MKAACRIFLDPRLCTKTATPILAWSTIWKGGRGRPIVSGAVKSLPNAYVSPTAIVSGSELAMFTATYRNGHVSGGGAPVIGPRS